HGFVKTDRRFIPVERRPLETPAAAFTRNAGDMQEQRAAVTAPAQRRTDVQVFQPETFHAQKRGEIVEVHREPGRSIAGVAEQDFRARLRAEQRFAQLRFARRYQVAQPLVFGEFSDEREYQRNVFRISAADVEFCCGILVHVTSPVRIKLSRGCAERVSVAQFSPAKPESRGIRRAGNRGTAAPCSTEIAPMDTRYGCPPAAARSRPAPEQACPFRYLPARIPPACGQCRCLRARRRGW